MVEIIIDDTSKLEEEYQTQFGEAEGGQYEVDYLSKLRRGAKHPRKANAYQFVVQVHWKGFKDMTWEPLENLMNDVPEMVEKIVLDEWKA